MARGWRGTAEKLVMKSGVGGLRRRFLAPSTAILAYHNIIPRGEPPIGDLSLHVDQDTFANQLDYILETHDIVDLSDVCGPAESPRPSVVITFDDAYAGCLSAGVDELNLRGLPATVFVPPGLLGNKGFWWDQLAPGGLQPLSEAIRDYGIVQLRGESKQILEWAWNQGINLLRLPWYARPVSEEALRSSLGSTNIGVGAHTWSHPNLALLDGPAVSLELDLSREWLDRWGGERTVDWLAYPYGCRISGGSTSSLEQFEGAVLIDGGLARRRGVWPASLYEVPRINVPRGLSLDGLGLRLTSFLR